MRLTFWDKLRVVIDDNHPLFRGSESTSLHNHLTHRFSRLEIDLLSPLYSSCDSSNSGRSWVRKYSISPWFQFIHGSMSIYQESCHSIRNRFPFLCLLALRSLAKKTTGISMLYESSSHTIRRWAVLMLHREKCFFKLFLVESAQSSSLLHCGQQL